MRGEKDTLKVLLLVGTLPFGLTGTETGWNEERLLEFWGSIRWDSRAVWLPACITVQEKRRMTPRVIQKSAGLPLPPQGGGKAISSLIVKDKAVSSSFLLGQDATHLLRACQEAGVSTQNHVSVGLESRKDRTQKDYSWALRSNKGKKDIMEFALLGFRHPWCTSPTLSLQLLLFGMGLSVLCLHTDLLPLGAHNLSGVSDSYLERNFPSGWTIPQVSPIPDLDDI